MNKPLITGTLGFLGGAAFVVIIFTTPHVFPLNGLSASADSALITGKGIPGQIDCDRLAINAREAAVVKANTAYEEAVNTAYAARGTALNSAYTSSSWSTVASGVKTTFTTFLTSMTSAQATLKTADQAATNSYNAAVTLCQANNPSSPPVLQKTPPTATTTPPTTPAPPTGPQQSLPPGVNQQ